MKQITYQRIKQTLKAMGFAFFDKGDYNLNIVGIRTANTAANSFDDFICVAYRVNGEPVVKVYPATTDPGLYWLENPMRVDGTAILVAPQQVRGAYKLGLHNGKYTALRQQKPFKYVRDNNKDERLDFYTGVNSDAKVQSGVIFANLHRASAWHASEEVGKYSAACQVVQNPKDFDELIGLCETAVPLHGETFTYTLLNEGNLI